MPSDFELLEAWQKGDKLAGNTLVRRHFAALHRFFTVKLGSAGEELVQDTFLACAAQRDRLPHEGSFKAYVFGIARRMLFQHFRREHLPSEVVEPRLDDLCTTMGGFVALRDEQRLLLSALRRVPIDQQIALELFYWEQMTISEIAMALDAPIGTVKARLSRARDEVREHLLRETASRHSLDSVRTGFDEWARDVGRDFATRHCGVRR